jgi:murein DD-endopeptidase MepM/ murein hydrolase activator NlpD
MKRLLILFLFVTSLFGSHVETFRWSDGETYLSFLERNKLPLKPLYYNLDEDEQQLTEEILSGINYHVSKGEKGELLQIFVPLNDELQIHIYKHNGSYSFETIPIISETKTEAFTLKIENSPYLDIIKETGSVKLATIFVNSFKTSLNFKKDLKKGDALAMIYEQKYRLGKPFSMPTLKVAMIEMSGKKNFIYLNEDEKFYNENGDESEEFLLATPVRNARISSEFTKKRFHPILNKYRAHLGVDYAASRGTPVLAAGDGRVVFVGESRGYGKTIKVQHSNDYLTLYAHLNSFKQGIRGGAGVKKGDIIAYVGSTGLSTGPHLHFGLYQDNTAVDPLKAVQIAAKKLQGKERVAFLKLVSNYKQSIELHLKNETKFERVSSSETLCYFNNGGTCEQDKLSSET